MSEKFNSFESAAFTCILFQASNSLELLRTASGESGTPSPGPDQGMSLKDRVHRDIKRPTVMEERSVYGHSYLSKLLKLYRDRRVYNKINII